MRRYKQEYRECIILCFTPVEYLLQSEVNILIKRRKQVNRRLELVGDIKIKIWLKKPKDWVLHKIIKFKEQKDIN